MWCAGGDARAHAHAHAHARSVCVCVCACVRALNRLRPSVCPIRTHLVELHACLPLHDVFQRGRHRTTLFLAGHGRRAGSSYSSSSCCAPSRGRDPLQLCLALLLRTLLLELLDGHLLALVALLSSATCRDARSEGLLLSLLRAIVARCCTWLGTESSLHSVHGEHPIKKKNGRMADHNAFVPQQRQRSES